MAMEILDGLDENNDWLILYGFCGDLGLYG